MISHTITLEEAYKYMKKKTSNLAVDAGKKDSSTLEERILRSDLAEQDKIEIIKIIGRQNSTGGSLTIPSWSPESNIVYCSCCCKE